MYLCFECDECAVGTGERAAFGCGWRGWRAGQRDGSRELLQLAAHEASAGLQPGLQCAPLPSSSLSLFFPPPCHELEPRDHYATLRAILFTLPGSGSTCPLACSTFEDILLMLESPIRSITSTFIFILIHSLTLCADVARDLSASDLERAARTSAGETENAPAQPQHTDSSAT